MFQTQTYISNVRMAEYAHAEFLCVADERKEKGLLYNGEFTYDFLHNCLYIHLMKVVVPLYCAKGIFEHYAAGTGILSSGLKLSGGAFRPEAGDQFVQIVKIGDALTACFR
jgi:hypothetical protein